MMAVPKETVSRKREICLRIGSARVKAPRVAGEYVQNFTSHRGYPTHLDSIWYILSWVAESGYLPPKEKLDGQVGDNRGEGATS